MSNKLYSNELKEDQKERLNFYERSERVISVPRDYFEQLKKGLSTELAKGYVETNVCLSHHLAISKEIEDLKKMIVSQNSRISDLEHIKEDNSPKIVVLDEISKEEAKKLVEDYFKEHGVADIEELMINLHIPVQTLVEIIDDLRNEGKLVPHKDE